MIDISGTWVNIVFVQDWDSESEEAEGATVPEWGDRDAMAEYLTAWDYGDETDGAHTFHREDPQENAREDTSEHTIGGLSYVLLTHRDLRYATLMRRPLA